MYKNHIKRIFDFIIALIALIILFPIMLVVSFCLVIVNKGTPFFSQQRPGKNGKLFKIIKFKTMNDKKDRQGKLLPDSQRLTWVGKIVRKTSLDELPQLINVLKGEMSLIGPRPLLVEYLTLYNTEQKRRHLVSPGITGWAQVNGRNTLSWDDKFEHDVWYMEHVSFLLDLKIFFLTLKKVLIKEGINQEGQASAEKFKGNY